MKFAALALLALSGTHALILPRGDHTLANCLNDVTSAITKLDAEAKAFEGTIQPVVNATDAVTDNIKTCQTIVDNSQPIGLSGALDLLKPVQEMDKRARNLLDAVKEKVDAVKKAKQCGLTRQKLGALCTAGRTLTQSICNKISNGMAKSIAKRHAGKIENLLTQSQEMFEPGKCDDVE
ncbi:cell wall protein [Metarhizium guizhouense ARSEF 977]|uniref:Cell wall protein n=1 Tax=Metarhizium guizhouense (strain ARSEF 977) TaxID=1276136 RepID=A0A0B4H8R8_METGA|nr:cell wall protein [Metarhizium guizhouense ARSEF 977]